MAEPMPAGENMFTKKYGPLPGWAWLVLTFAIVFVYMKWKASKAASTTQTTTGTNTGTSNALTSNLVGVQEPVPTLAGTYQVSVQPAIASYNANPSGQLGMSNPPSGTMTGTNTTSANANQTANV